jgi:hypothetical protein
MVRETLRSNQSAQAHAALLTTDPMVAYRHFLHLARALPAAGVLVCTVDVEVAHSNVERALAAMAPHFTTAQGKLPRLAIPPLLEVRTLALALIFAAERIVLASIDGALLHRLLRLRYLRDLTLRQIEIFAHLGLVPGEEMRAVSTGVGPIESARSALSILDLFARHDERIGGKHPFTDEQLTELQGHAQWLIEEVRPGNEGGGSVERDRAVGLRDRFWTLLFNRYEDLREAAATVFGADHLDRDVPPLGNVPITETFWSGVVPRTARG